MIWKPGGGESRSAVKTIFGARRDDHEKEAAALPCHVFLHKSRQRHIEDASIGRSWRWTRSRMVKRKSWGGGGGQRRPIQSLDWLQSARRSREMDIDSAETSLQERGDEKGMVGRERKEGIGGKVTGKHQVAVGWGGDPM